MITANHTVFGRRYGNQLLTGLVASYPFNSNANDSVNGMNGTEHNTDYVSGKTGNAVRLNSTSDYIDIADNDNFSFTAGGGVDIAFSQSFWTYPTGWSGVGNWIFSKRDTGSNDEWQIVMISGTIYFMIFTDTSNYIGVVSSSTVSLNAWSHIVVTYSGSKTNAGLKIYINNTLSGSSNINAGTYTGMSNGNNLVRVGLPSWNSGLPYAHQGYLDEWDVWKNRALSTGDISELYNAGSGKAYPF